jgi:IclR family transcriptional regulator, KDG regulon repressor
MPLIQSIERALRIIELFDEYTTELKITEISTRMNLNKSTVHSLLMTLKKYNYIDQDTESGKYKLGLKLFERGNLVIHNLDIRTIAKQHLLELSMKTGHTLHLVILDGNEGLYIDKVEGTSATVVYSRIGRRIPIHSSGVGKALLAFKDAQKLNNILDGYVFKKQTDKTISNEEEFRKELDIVREKGYAIDREENEPGICCIAVPLYNHSGEVIAAFSLSMPAPKLTEFQLNEIIPLLKDVGNKISKQLGYNPYSNAFSE